MNKQLNKRNDLSQPKVYFVNRSDNDMYRTMSFNTINSMYVQYCHRDAFYTISLHRFSFFTRQFTYFFPEFSKHADSLKAPLESYLDPMKHQEKFHQSIIFK